MDPPAPLGLRVKRRLAIAAALVAIVLFVVLRRDRETEPAPPPVAPASPKPPAAAPLPPRAPGQSRPVAPVQLTRAPTVKAAPAPAAPGALEGLVIDADSEQGIAGAVLTFSHEDGAYETVSAGGGAFRFAPRAAGAYRLVSLEAKGSAPFEGEFGKSPVSFTSAPGRDVSGVVLRLVPEHEQRRRRERPGRADAAVFTGSLRGRVTDARTGAAVPVFAIALWKKEGLAYSQMLSPASFIDPDGTYQIDGLAPGRYEATAIAAGYAASQYAVAEIADGPAQADFALRGGTRIHGTVRDDRSSGPIAGALIELEGRRGNAPDLPAAPLSPSTATGIDGTFLLEHVPPDSGSVSVEKEGYLTRLVALPADRDDVTVDVRLTLREGTDARVELTGIGAVLRATGDALVLDRVLPSAGAADAGLAVGDQILAIDGVSVVKLGYEGSIAAIRGPEGTTVTLRVRRGQGEGDIIVTRKLVRG